MWGAIIGAGLSVAGSLAGGYLADKNRPELDLSAYNNYLKKAQELNTNNTIEKVSEEASKLTAQQGGVAGQNALESLASAGASRGQAMAQANGTASQTALNGFASNMGAVQQQNQNEYNNQMGLANAALNGATTQYDADKNESNRRTAMIAHLNDAFSSFGNSIGSRMDQSKANTANSVNLPNIGQNNRTLRYQNMPVQLKPAYLQNSDYMKTYAQ